MGILSEYEARLFQQWAFHVPLSISRDYTEPHNNFYDEDTFIYPFPDELFWKKGDEGTGDIEWVDVVPEEEPEGGSESSRPVGSPAKRKRASTGTRAGSVLGGE
jgi:hypothetical protein